MRTGHDFATPDPPRIPAPRVGARRRSRRIVALRRAGGGTRIRPPLHVVIVGAGLAGLCAGYELEKRGHRVTMLEADAKHIGGRTRTLRFGDGLYGEAGAMRIPTRHEITRRYVSEFGLPLRKFVLSNPQGVLLPARRARAHRRRRAS